MDAAAVVLTGVNGEIPVPRHFAPIVFHNGTMVFHNGTRRNTYEKTTNTPITSSKTA